MKRTLLCLSATILACIAAAPPASASHVNCGDVITQDTRLDSDLVNCPGDGVVIGAAFITLDLAGHTIDGTGGGEGVDNNAGHDGVTVRRGRIQEFSTSVLFNHANGGSLGRLTGPGPGGNIQLSDSDFNTIERNDLSTGIAVFGGSDGNIINRNTNNGPGVSVFVSGSDGNKVTRNRLIGAGDSYAVFVTASDDTVIEANEIRDHSGIGIAMSLGGVRNRIQRNTVSGTGEGGITLDGTLDDTLVLRNHVTDSAVDGIRIGSLTTRTVVERNTASRNGDDGIDSDAASAAITKNTANFNGDLGIEAVPGVTDGGGNKAKGNGNAAQCVGVSCS